MEDSDWRTVWKRVVEREPAHGKGYICHEIRPYIEKEVSATYPVYYHVELFLMQGNYLGGAEVSCHYLEAGYYVEY